MTSNTLQMLLERLLWPVPRVRWEVARSVAKLIRDGDARVGNALLNWLSDRRLESEAALGLGIIDAFALARHFEFSDVLEAVQMPSLLSDVILKRNFADARGLSPFRYTVSPLQPATLPWDERAWFEHYREWAVPPVFSMTFTKLQDETGFPFMGRWEHDWRWLQVTDPRPEAKYPYYFSKGDRERRGWFDQGQRELYASAYLRTLAYAAIRGWLPYDAAERHAMLAVTMNRGLAEVEPIDRPDWTRGLLPWESGHTKEVVQQLWERAETDTKSDDVPLALRVVDCQKNDFVEVDVVLTVGSCGFRAGRADAQNLRALVPRDRPGDLAGPVAQDAGVNSVPIRHPVSMVQAVVPEPLGRVHLDMALEIRLASPYLFGTPASIRTTPSEVRLEANTEVLSRWVYWYVNWEPTVSCGLKSAVGSITSVSADAMRKVSLYAGLELARLVRIRKAVKRESYMKHEVETETYWL